MKFAHALFEKQRAQSEFEDSLSEAGFEDYGRIRGDDYDQSVEFDEVGNDVRLTAEQQKIISDAGFAKAFVNHKDGWETRYSWGAPEPFAPSRGWRRRWVADPTVSTTNVIGADPKPEDRGYYEISYWPEGWVSPSTRHWRETGYMRVVPDPLESLPEPRAT